MTVPLFGAEQEVTTSDDYLTPSWVFDSLDLEFDVDVAASPLGGWVPAAREYTKADDGLAQEWAGRVWMNPPYSNVSRWAERFAEHGEGVALLPFAKSQWFNKLWQVPAATFVVPPKRFDFGGGGISVAVFFVAFGDECAEAIGRVGHVR